MSKRKFYLDRELTFEASKRKLNTFEGKKHSLDSDEEDEVEDNGVLHPDDIEGEEEGISRQEDGNRMTAFNMNEELEEGHFDNQGNFIWTNDKAIRDNWLDNVEWHEIKNDPKRQYILTDSAAELDEDSSYSDTEEFDEIKNYEGLLELMKPGETVYKALNRLGGSKKKLSSVERLKRKKAGILIENQDVTTLTALADRNLTSLGNTDVYQETYEAISKKIHSKRNPINAEHDMFAEDDFQSIHKPEPSSSEALVDKRETNSGEVMWEFKWHQNSQEVHGPHSSSQMQQWVQDGYFKNGIFVRKHGKMSNFYHSNRIDFDLYI